MKIYLMSNSLSRSELEAGLSLARAFFPGASIQVLELTNEVDRESNLKWTGFSEAKTELGEWESSLEDCSRIQVEIAVKETLWQVEGYYDRKVHQNLPSNNPEISVFFEPEQIQIVLSHNRVGKESEKKLLLKQVLFKLLAQATGHVPPWGILTGIRPSKIPHRLYDLKVSDSMTEKLLKEQYLIRADKVSLLQEVVSIQRPFLKEIMEEPKGIAVYVGIPFCPTRCTYCSFPAYSLQKGRQPLFAYLQGLFEEIRVTGEWMKATGRFADSLYIGGGTPTILSTSELSELLQYLWRYIPVRNAQSSSLSLQPSVSELSQLREGVRGVELTVEAGRPDTLSKEKLQALRDLGVNRLSINPQTMHNRTLTRIGRSHSVEDIRRVYRYAREISNWVINMDLILGLPGEYPRDIEDSLKQIGELSPDNLTVHALALKRGSKEHETGFALNLSKELEVMQDIVLENARAMRMQPYYLYRQKQIAGNLENIGFARPGLECRYNIGIMEERQSVLGIGAGASSKIVNPRDYSLVNILHPSNWQVYLDRWMEDHKKRILEWAKVDEK